ncbi:Sir2_family protein [Hexamita inflata]|uniref:Sir2 family protein n=1 Tax=Hexamita inflata TaxID=28002 RepID=A0AA86UTR5_9EUKA|nr:Sir2 family protein [Hexamita inflata]
MTFPRISNLVKDIQDTDVSFTVILGAGASVSAGFPAFRSNSSIFKQIAGDYENWPGKDSSEDSFLAFAFSISSICIDPRVHYRVLHKFDCCMHDTNVKPTYTHIFIQYLAQHNKISSLITQNIDDLEIHVGLQTVLNNRLIQAHGSLEQPPVCINKYCASRSINIRNQQRLSLDFRFYYNRTPIESPEKDIISYIKYSKNAFIAAMQDNSVPCCMFCGCALKPAMVLYGENVLISHKQLLYASKSCQSLLIIGTSLEVEPINKIPVRLDQKSSIHLSTKSLDFKKYFNYLHDSKVNFYHIMEKRFKIAKYKNGEQYMSKLKQLLQQKSAKNEAIDDYILLNKITPLFNYHKGPCDELFKAIAKQIPDCEKELLAIEDIIRNKNRNRVLFQDSPNYFKCMIGVNFLWPPDACLYQLNNSWYSLALLSQQQLDLILNRVSNSQLVDFNSYKLIQYEPLCDFYRPIGGHWSCYMVAYNAYRVRCDCYNAEVDPWSASYIFSQKRTEQMFRYWDVLRQFQLTRDGFGELYEEYQKKTLELFGNQVEMAKVQFIQ